MSNYIMLNNSNSSIINISPLKVHQAEDYYCSEYAASACERLNSFCNPFARRRISWMAA